MPLAATGNTVANGFSGDKFVGSYTDGSGNSHGFIKSGTNYITLDDPAASIGTYPNGGTYPTGISGNTVVGSFIHNGNFRQGFIYDTTSGTYQTENDPNGTWGTTFNGVSGNFVVGSNAHPPSGIGDNGIIYNISDATYTYFNDPQGAGGQSTIGTGISGNTVVGYYEDVSGAVHGFIYNLQSSTYTNVDAPLAGSGKDTRIEGVFGNTIVGYYVDNSNRSHGFVESGGVYSTLDVPGATHTYAWGTDGNKVSGYFQDGTGYHGFVATPNAGVNIALYAGYAGVTINGVVGYTYGVQTSTNLANTNSWVGVTNITLSLSLIHI